MLFYTLVIVSSIGSSFGIRNSYAQAQQQLEPRQAPTIAYNSPWSNNLQISSAGSNSQPLCAAGVCNQSLNPATNTQTTTADPTKITLSNTQTSTNDKTLSLRHSFVSNN